MHRRTVAAAAVGAVVVVVTDQLHVWGRLRRRIGLDLGKPHSLLLLLLKLVRGMMRQVRCLRVAAAAAGTRMYLVLGQLAMHMDGRLERIDRRTRRRDMHAHGLGVHRRYPRIWRCGGVTAHHTQRRTELDLRPHRHARLQRLQGLRRLSAPD